MKKVLFYLFFLFSFYLISDANSVARLQRCTPMAPGATSQGTGLDGSNCDVQLVCSDAGVCVNTSETGCIGAPGSGSCGIGQRCVTDTGIAPTGAGGICETKSGGSAENNAIGDILCNAYKVATGKIGRGIVVVVLFVTGISFYLGKVQWGTIVAIVIGAGLCFGGPAIVSVLVGRNFLC